MQNGRVKPQITGTPMRSRLAVPLALFALVGLAAALTALDLAVDAGTAAVPDFVADFVDRLVMIGAMFASAYVVLRISEIGTRTQDLESAVGRSVDEGRAWRAQSRRFVDGLSRAIDAQFDVWLLTPAEADVAGLLLKGAPLREIAALRRTSEATIRQQAQSVYRKSGLGNRSELSAYFLEDLFTLSEASIPEKSNPDAHYDA